MTQCMHTLLIYAWVAPKQNVGWQLTTDRAIKSQQCRALTACTTGLMASPMRSAKARKGRPEKGSDAASTWGTAAGAASKRECRAASGVGSLRSAPMCRLKVCRKSKHSQFTLPPMDANRTARSRAANQRATTDFRSTRMLTGHAPPRIVKSERRSCNACDMHLNRVPTTKYLRIRGTQDGVLDSHHNCPARAKTATWTSEHMLGAGSVRRLAGGHYHEDSTAECH
jgi:hypothetical protein